VSVTVYGIGKMTREQIREVARAMRDRLRELDGDAAARAVAAIRGRAIELRLYAAGHPSPGDMRVATHHATVYIGTVGELLDGMQRGISFGPLMVHEIAISALEVAPLPIAEAPGTTLAAPEGT
jgi:hypothetical protein